MAIFDPVFNDETNGSVVSRSASDYTDSELDSTVMNEFNDYAANNPVSDDPNFTGEDYQPIKSESNANRSSIVDPVFGGQDDGGMPSNKDPELNNPAYKMGRGESGFNSAVRGFGNMLSSVPKAIGEGAVAIANKFGDDPVFGNPEEVTPEETYFGQLGQSMGDWLDNNFPASDEFKGEFLAQRLPEGFGSMVGFMAGGVTGAIAKVPTIATVGGLGMASGVASGAQDYVDTQKKNGAEIDPEERANVAALNGLLGVSEALPIQRLFGRINQASGGGVSKILKEGFKGGAEELTQEVFQQIGQNAIAKNIVKYDPERDLWEGAQDGAEVGFTLGFLLNSLASAVGGRRGASAGSTNQTPVEAEDVIGADPAQEINDPVFDGIKYPETSIKQKGEYPKYQEFNDIDLTPKSPDIEKPLPNQDEIDDKKTLAFLENEQSVNNIFDQLEDTNNNRKKTQTEQMAKAAENSRQIENNNTDEPNKALDSAMPSSTGKIIGKKFKTRKSAELHIKSKKLKQHIPIKVDGKWAVKESIYADGRLEDDTYRNRLSMMSDDMTSGGGVTYLRNEREEITGRTKSINPDWAQSVLAEEKTTVKSVQSAVDKSLNGQSLGVKQVRIIGAMLDEIDIQRNESDKSWQADKQFNYNEFVSSQREKAKSLREYGRNSKKRRNTELMQSYDEDAQKFAGELYEEDVYSEDMQGESRSLLELMEQANEAGASELEVENILQETMLSNKQVSSLLFDLIEKSNERRTRNDSSARSLDTIQEEQEKQAEAETQSLLSGTEGGSPRVKSNKRREGITLDPPENKQKQNIKTPSNEGVVVSGDQDLFGDKDEVKQAIHNKKIDRQNKIDNSPEMSEGKGDLFSDKSKQVELEDVANQAATSPKNDLPQPTDAQKKAGNYKKGKISLHGLNISIENPKGSTRSGTDRDGKKWSVEMKYHYGDFKRTEGNDGDNVDVFLSDDAENTNHPVFVVDQINPKSRRFDEHKVMMGFPSEQVARDAYLSNYEKNWQGIGGVKQFSIPEFKDWLKNGDTKKRAAIPDKQKSLKKKMTRKSVEKPDAPTEQKDSIDKLKNNISGNEYEVKALKRKLNDISGKLREIPSWKETGRSNRSKKFGKAIDTLTNQEQEVFKSLTKAERKLTKSKNILAGYSDGKLHANGMPKSQTDKENKVNDDFSRYIKSVVNVGDRIKVIATGSIEEVLKLNKKTVSVETWSGKQTRRYIDVTPIFGGAPQSAKEAAESARKFNSNIDDTATSKQSEPKEKAEKNNYGKKNKLFTEDAAEKARAILKKKLNNLNAGIDPEIMQAGLTLAGYHIEAGARKFTDFAKVMTDDLGDGIKPFLRAFYESVRYYPGIDNTQMTPSSEIDEINLDENTGGNKNAASKPSNLESNSAERQAQDNAETVLDDGGRVGSGNGNAGGSPGKSRAARQSDNSVSSDNAVTDRARSNTDLFEQDGEPSVDGSTTGSAGRGRGGSSGDKRVPVKRKRSESIEENAKTSDGEFKRKLILQEKAEKVPVVLSDADNIEKTLPLLFPEQQSDVLFAEKRLANNRGVLFTNGTGTGKTFTGLGIIKRFYKQGMTEILITVPSKKIASDWVKSGKALGLEISDLKDTKDAGNGITVATYANFSKNSEIVNREWDLLVHDESHRLSENEKGDSTSSLDMGRALTGHPSSRNYYTRLKEPDLVNEIEQIKSKISEYDKSDNQQLFAKIPALRNKLEKLGKKFKEKSEAHKLNREEAWNNQNTKTLYLSATPFAYEKSVIYAEGYLFDFPKENENTAGAYNHSDGRESFFIEHFGYRMRYGKLTQPEADVDNGLMQRQFNSYLKKSGALSGRMLDVEHDYSREFIAIDDLVGNKIDEGIEYIGEKAGDKDNELAEGYELLKSELGDKFNYHVRVRLLEAIKAKHAIPRIRKHLALGRKVVIFHSRIKGGGFHPFKFDTTGMDGPFVRAVQEFNRERKDLVNLDLSSLKSPLDLFKEEFGSDVTFYNGTLKNKDKIENPNKFNRDEGDKAEIIVLQDDGGKEGISLHDTTNKHQRVLMNLGLPVKPTQSIQIEGRTYRVGQMSDAIFEYFNTGTSFERWTFASKIATRASTAENLALGEDARGLKEAFIDAFENPNSDAPSLNQGKGGKSRDRALASTLTEFDRAKSYYFGTEKNSKRRDQREGADYFATPEPLGLKMVEWANIKAGEKVLEPSAGHGAIGRFFPDNTDNLFVEPSSQLGSKLALRINGNIRQMRFEDLDTGGNKFDAIVMNPPFGVGGKTAIEHLGKATKHLKNGGRVVAIIPNGGATKKKFDNFLYGEKAPKNIYLVAIIELPNVTFKRAGTNVSANIVVLDRYDNSVDAPIHVTRDFSTSETVKEFFDSIESSTITERTQPTPTVKEIEVAKEKGETGVKSLDDAGIFVKQSETKNGKQVWEVTGETFPYKDAIKAAGGRWYGPKKAWSFYDGDPTEALANEIGETPKLSKQKEPANRGFSVSDVRKVVSKTVGDWRNAPSIKVVQSVQDMPGYLSDYIQSIDAGNQVEGLFAPKDKSIYIVANNLKDEKSIQRVIFHEALGHYGLREMFGSDTTQILSQVYISYGRKNLKDIADRYELDLNKKTDRLIAAEEKIAEMAEKNENPTLLNKVIAAIRNLMKKLGIKLTLNDSDIKVMLSDMRQYVTEGSPVVMRGSLSDVSAPMLSVKKDEKQEKFTRDLSAGEPIDKAFQKVFEMARIPKLTKGFMSQIEKTIVDRKFNKDGFMDWANPLVETARAGIIDRYGLSDEYIKRDRQRDTEKRGMQTELKEIVEKMLDNGMTMKEAEIFTRMLQGENIPDNKWTQLALPVRKAIDDMGHEMVELGLLDAETYEKNRGSWLHRVYLNHESEKTNVGKWVSKKMSQRRSKMKGDELRMRGMKIDIKMDRLLKIVPAEFWGRRKELGRADNSLKGEKFAVFDRLEHTGEGTGTLDGIEAGGKKPRVLERVYWPLSLGDAPAKYQAWKDKGEWEVRDTKGDKIMLWRDFTKSERESMGEILDARYVVAKTYMLMSNDLTTGRFYVDVAKNPEWTWTHKDPPDASLIGKSNDVLGTFTGDYEWVKVPETKLPGTSKAQWGALSGRYVRAEIWRDLHELNRMQNPTMWRKLLTQWKLNKTSRNPVVHMNNVMSNFMLMDLADVRWRDFARGMQAMRNETDDYKDAMEHGVFGSSFVEQEIRKNILDDVLSDIKKQSDSEKETVEGRFKLLNTLWTKIWEYDKKMTDAYQFEDEVFRMATYMRRLSQGYSKEDAARIARDQFLNYDIRAPWINTLRNTVLPFISYTYRAVPVIANSVAERPWKLAKYFTLAYMVNSLAYMLWPGDEEEERKSMQKGMQGDTWLQVPRTVRLWKNENDDPVFLDIRRWIPAGDVYDLNQGHSAIPIPSPLQFGGPLMLAAEMALNKQSFTGREITDINDTPGEKAEKVGMWAYRSWMPSALWLPGSWYWNKIDRSISGGRDSIGRDYSATEAVLSSLGIKIAPHDVELGFEYRLREFNRIKSSLKTELSRLEKDKARGIIDGQQYMKDRELLKIKLNRLEGRTKELLSK